MKRIIALTCVLCVFAFAVPSADAIKIPAKRKVFEPTITNDGTEIAKIKIPARRKMFEPAITNDGIETAAIKIKAKKIKYYEPSNPDNLIAARRRVGRGPGCGVGG